MIEWLESKIKQASESANIADFENYSALLEMWADRLNGKLKEEV